MDQRKDSSSRVCSLQRFMESIGHGIKLNQSIAIRCLRNANHKRIKVSWFLFPHLCLGGRSWFEDWGAITTGAGSGLSIRPPFDLRFGWDGMATRDFLPFVFSEAASGTLDVGLVNTGRGLDGESLRVLLLFGRRHLWLVLRLCGGYIVAGQ